MNESRNTRTALVLGGGGSTGNAWLIGVVAGLHEAGLDVTDADLIIGTSAGSTAAAQITSAGTAELLAVTLAPVAQRVTRPGSDAPRPSPVVDQLDRMKLIIAGSSDASDLRRRLCAAALARDAESDGAWTSRWRSIVAPRLPQPDWPRQSVLITAVNAETSESAVFDGDSNVELVDAVAASTSSGLPYWIDGIPYLDGGFRTNAENADLAGGYDRVLVLSPFGGRSLVPQEWGTHLSTQVDALRAGGSTVETIFPPGESEHLFGPNGMDLSLRPAAARVGLEQGRADAERLAAFWR
ncbi:MAG: patatin-like phospholipase family protein [Pseudolysinimonas sp.]